MQIISLFFENLIFFIYLFENKSLLLRLGFNNEIMKKQLSFLANCLSKRELRILTAVFSFYSVIGFGQTFTTTGLTNLSSGTTKTITVSGVPSNYVLQQVNLKFGDGSSSYSASIYQANVTLKNPAGVTKNLITTTSLGGGTDSGLKWFNIHLRDMAGLKTPNAQKGSGSVNAGYPFNYGYYAPAESWAAFNTGSYDGNWVLTVNSIGSTTYQRKFHTIELIFGPPLSAPIDIKGGNMSCATKKCIQTGGVYLATNTSYTNGQTNPAQLIGTCRWNADDNNKSWFSFIASSTTAELSFSGLSTPQQSVIVQASPTNDCLATFTSVPSGGCMSEMIGSSSDTKYGNSGYSAGNGLRWNHGYSLTGLTIGQMYIFVIEGSENANSDFLIEIKSGANGAPAPSANDQAFCGSSTVANLAPSGLNWYTSATGGSPLASGTALANNTDYYAEQGGACPSARKKIKVTLDANPTKPTSISATPTYRD